MKGNAVLRHVLPVLALSGLVATGLAEPASAGASGVVFGASVAAKTGETFTQAVARQDAAYGTPTPMPISRVFLNAVTTWSATTAAVSGRPVVVSFKYTPASIIAGTNDAALIRFFSTMPDYNVYWSYIHEPEDNIARGEFTSTDYKLAWQHIADLAAANAPLTAHLHSTLILMCYTLNPASGRDWHNYYQATAQSMIAFDCYNHAGKRNSYGDPANIFKPITDWEATAEGSAIPWGISEVGSTLGNTDTDGALRAQWLRNVATFLVNQHTVDPKRSIFGIYFDVVGPSGTDYRLTDANSQAAWRDVVQNY